MAENGPRIMAYCYSEGPITGAAAAITANSTISVIESATPGTTTEARPLTPELFTTQLTTWQTHLTTYAPAGTYELIYDASTQRVTIETTNGISFVPVMDGNLAVWLGFTQLIAGGAFTWLAESAPAAIAELLAVTVQPAEDAARVDLSEYRHGRAVATVWGNHQVHRVTIVFSRTTTLSQIAAGYLTTGRVRIWQAGDATAYAADNVDGYVDGFVIAADEPVESGDVGELWSLNLLVGVAR